ncbi:heparinase II/III family protein [Candidatus Poribacteria bacterium]
MPIVKTFFLIILVSFIYSTATHAGMPRLILSDYEDASFEQRGSSIEWSHGEQNSISISQFPHDWSKYNQLSFQLHSRRATGSQFMIILSSENDKTEGMDYYSIRMTLNFTGWRRYAIPFAEIGSARSPLGWDNIQRLMFTASGWGNEPHPEAEVIIYGIMVSREAPMKGPRITDKEFMNALNLDYPGLEKIKALVSRNDIEDAKHEFVAYIKRREKPVWHFDWRGRPEVKTSDRPDTRAADKILERELPSVGVPHKFEGEIDWTLNPIDYREWPWQLNRHPFWVTLGRAYWSTGDEKYAKEFVYQMTHWVENCPVPTMNSGNSSATWRTIEAGIRTSGSWMHAFHYFLSSPSFTDEAVITMMKSFMEHARHLMTWPTGGNWLTMESNGLFHIGVMFPEFTEAGEWLMLPELKQTDGMLPELKKVDGWRKTAVKRMYEELDNQIYPDGAQIELTTGYHQVSLRNFVGLMKIAALNEVDMPADYLGKLEIMYHYNLYASMPNGRLPGLNDGSELSIRRSMEEGFGYFPHRGDFQWSATGGAEGEGPTENSYAFPYAGHFVMRSGWDKEDRYLLMDAGPFGYGHQHEDKLSFVLYAHGKVHVTDPGNYAYDSSQWRRYIISTYAHNTILVDEMPQNRRRLPRDTFVVKEPLPNKWVSKDNYDYCVSVYGDGYGSEGDQTVSHKRRIFFVKPDYWIVTDTLAPSDDAEHKYESMFHLNADNATIDEETNMVETQNTDASNLAIIPPQGDDLTVEIISGQEEPVVQGWVPAGGYKVRPIPTPIFTKTGKGATWFVYIFYPTPKGEKLPIKSVEPLEVKSDGGIYPDARAVKISFDDGRIHYFLQADQEGKILSFADFTTDAEIMLIKVDSGGNVEDTIPVE